MLENHGFDRPTRIMWTFDDGVRDAIAASYALLREDKYEEFLASVPETLAKLRDLNSKELEVLLPTSYKLLSDEEFVRMSKNDHEIGYAIINATRFICSARYQRFRSLIKWKYCWSK